MTEKQKAVYDFILSYCREHGFSPSYVEITKAVGMNSKSSVVGIVDALERGGHVQRIPHRARAIMPVELINESRIAEAADCLTIILHRYDAAETTSIAAMEAVRAVRDALKDPA